MWAEIEPVHMRGVRIENRLESVVDRFHVLDGVKPQRYAPLIGYNDHAYSCSIKLADGCRDAWQHFKVEPGSDVLPLRHLPVDYPIPVQEDG